MLRPFVFLGVHFHSGLRKRWHFEGLNDNKDDPFQVSFLESLQNACRCYHVSSEGEWEQAWPFILEDLREGLKTEVLYTSESLEKRVQQSKMALESRLIRFHRLPLLKFVRLTSWVSARDFVMCRYDFFPELVFLGLRCQKNGGQFFLLSASLKSKKTMLSRSGAWPFVFWAWLYSQFDRICLASGLEKERFSELGINPRKLWSYEARGLQILWRLKNYRHTLEQKGLSGFVKHVEELGTRAERLILGSAWEGDIQVLKRSLQEWSQKPLVLIAPHSLDPGVLQQMKSELLPYSHVYIYSQKSPLSELKAALQSQSVIIFAERGVLLELYPLFGHAFIGGGFGRSVHSVLEPYLAHCHVYCGPKTHRSTEVDIIEFERSDALTFVKSSEEQLVLVGAQQDEMIAKDFTPSYYEDLYKKELKKFEDVRRFFSA